MGNTGAWLNIAGLILSGPLGLALVSIVHPSPSWQGAATYAYNFHWIQTVPFFGGFALIVGYVLMFAAIYHVSDDTKRPAAMVSVVATAALFMILNGIVSIIGAIVTSFDLGWVLTITGVVSYAGWNILVFAMAILIYLSFRKKRSEMALAV
jgi:hypothetical protein